MSDIFMCRCSDEGIRECNEMLDRARAVVSAKHPLEGDLDFADRMIFWIALDGQLTIAADQWAGVFVQPFEKYPSEKIKTPYAVQCDYVTDGLAAAIVHYYESPDR